MGYKALLPEKDLAFCKMDGNKEEVNVYAVVKQRQDDLSMIRGL